LIADSDRLERMATIVKCIGQMCAVGKKRHRAFSSSPSCNQNCRQLKNSKSTLADLSRHATVPEQLIDSIIAVPLQNPLCFRRETSISISRNPNRYKPKMVVAQDRLLRMFQRCWPAILSGCRRLRATLKPPE